MNSTELKKNWINFWYEYLLMWFLPTRLGLPSKAALRDVPGSDLGKNDAASPHSITSKRDAAAAPLRRNNPTRQRDRRGEGTVRKERKPTSENKHRNLLRLLLPAKGKPCPALRTLVLYETRSTAPNPRVMCEPFNLPNKKKKLSADFKTTVTEQHLGEMWPALYCGPQGHGQWTFVRH